jgi:glycosyltransferase involved in cell wall biosynthesis
MASTGLAALGHHVVIAAPPDSLLAQRARAAGLPTCEDLAFRKTKHLVATARDVVRLAAHLRRERYDLVNANGSQDLWTSVAARALSGLETPLVFTRHNTKRVAAHAANRWVYRRLDHLILENAAILERYEAFLASGVIRRERVSVIDGAYRVDRFHPGVDGRPVRAELGIAPEVPVVGVVARLVPDKGHEDLLRAAVIVLARRPETRFLLVGTGTLEGALRSLAETLGVAPAVRFLGFREDMPRITAALDLSVLPSVDCDASSTVLKEALACGVPAVATTVGGASGILRDGVTGLLVPPHDPDRLAEAILTIVADPRRGREMGRRGSLDVQERFRPERLAARTLETYEEVLERPGRALRGRAAAAR